MTSINNIRSASDLYQYFREHDKNHDGQIDIEKEAPAADRAELKKMDKDYLGVGNGSITEKELLEAMQSRLGLKPEHMESMLKARNAIAIIKATPKGAIGGEYFYKNSNLLYPIKTEPAFSEGSEQSKVFDEAEDVWVDAMLHDENEEVRIYALLGLKKIYRQINLDAVIAALKDPSDKVKVLAIDLIGFMELSKAKDALIPLLKSPDMHVRASALKALQSEDDPKTEKAFMEVLLTDKNAKNRAAAAFSLDRRFSSSMNLSIGSTLVIALKDPDKDVRFNVIRALQPLKYSGAVDLLIEIMRKDSDVNNREAAFDTLQELNSDKAKDALTAALDGPDKKIQWKAIRFAEEVLNPKATDKLIAILKRNSDPTYRSAAADALQKYKGEKVTQALLHTLKDKDWYVCRAAIWALGARRDPKTMASLKEAMERTDRTRPALPVDPVINDFLKTLTPQDEEISQLTIAGLSAPNPEIFHRLTTHANPKAKDALVLLAKKGEEQAQEMARKILYLMWRSGKIESEKAAEAFVFSVKNNIGINNIKAISILAEISPSIATDTLIDVLDQHIDLDAIQVLGYLKNSRAIPTLLKLSAHENQTISETAQWALKEITDGPVIYGADPLYK